MKIRNNEITKSALSIKVGTIFSGRIGYPISNISSDNSERGIFLRINKGIVDLEDPQEVWDVINTFIYVFNYQELDAELIVRNKQGE